MNVFIGNKKFKDLEEDNTNATTTGTRLSGDTNSNEGGMQGTEFAEDYKFL